MSLYIDVTEFLANPITTGIQRVVGEVCKHMPSESAIPLRLHLGRYVALPPSLLRAIGQHFRNPSKQGLDEIRRLAAAEGFRRVDISQADTVLIPEAFIDQCRVAFFKSMPHAEFERCRFIIYDLFPLTHPQYFSSDEFLEGIYGYFHVTRSARRNGFISEYTRDTFCKRFKRKNVGEDTILPLGCDSLGPRAKTPLLHRSLVFTVLGTIEPRKNHALILEAFEPLLRQIEGLQLSFVGSMGWIEREFAEKIYALAHDRKSGFHFHPSPDDATMRKHIEQSRATIYVSASEGYGLPPVESLWCGTPVIASCNIPSLQKIGTAGVHYVEPLSAEKLRQAVLAFLDDDYANQKAKEATELDLPTWEGFAKEVFRWCSQ
jgi:glycosyltransferase involved in cell wall biosynthesis